MQLFTRWRQSDQIKIDSPEEDCPGSCWQRSETGSLMCGGNERVDGIAGPGGVSHVWQLCSLRRLKRPMVPRGLFRPFVVGRANSIGNPTLDSGDLFIGEWFTFRRHPLDLVGGSDTRDELTGVDLARDGDGPVVAPFPNELARIEPQSGFLLQCAVTTVTAGFENRLDLAEIVN